MRVNVQFFTHIKIRNARMDFDNEKSAVFELLHVDVVFLRASIYIV